MLETTNSLPYKKDAPATIINSFKITIIIIHIGIIFFKAKVAKVIICVHLSAKGSISFPKLVIKLNFLAIKPSNISVKPETVNITNAAKYLSLAKFNTINGISTVSYTHLTLPTTSRV